MPFLAISLSLSLNNGALAYDFVDDLQSMSSNSSTTTTSATHIHHCTSSDSETTWTASSAICHARSESPPLLGMAYVAEVDVGAFTEYCTSSDFDCGEGFGFAANNNFEGFKLFVEQDDANLIGAVCGFTLVYAPSLTTSRLAAALVILQVAFRLGLQEISGMVLVVPQPRCLYLCNCCPFPPDLGKTRNQSKKLWAPALLKNLLEMT
ncbi:hypothetical protein RHGRI_023609 [Rhododendron griersonianum]|uniref:Uncharacterized protein n=1 Tax=Rhododendron griersonianum TaxID=479676 RepID=A0AAV6J7H3_9ERIC|nr:hypothetical protein RHGRI_023609 [Rhododendron griersonianum]